MTLPSNDKVAAAAKKISDAGCVFCRAKVFGTDEAVWKLTKPPDHKLDQVFQNMHYEEAVVLASEELE